MATRDGEAVNTFGEEATTSDKWFAAGCAALPFISGSALKKGLDFLGSIFKQSDKVSLDANAISAAIKEGKLQDVKNAIGSDKPIVSITAAKESMSYHGKESVKEFMKETGATISKNGGSSSQVEALQKQAQSMGRAVGKNDASIIAGAANNNATVITNDKKMTKFMNAINQPVKGY